MNALEGIPGESELLEDQDENLESLVVVPEKHEVRSFTKEHRQEDRKEVAGRIRELRQEHFARLEALSGEAKIYTEKGEKLSDIVTGTQEVISELASEIATLERNAFINFLHFRKNARLRNEQERHEETFAAVREELGQVDLRKNEIFEQLENRNQLDEARATLEDFYDQKSKSYKEYLEDHHDSQLENVREKYDCGIVHGFLLDRTPEANSLILGTATWQEKLDVLLGFEPTVSTSTIKERESALHHQVWSPVGVFLHSGVVEFADKNDAASVAQVGGGREVSEGRWDIKKGRVGKQIDNAISQKTGNSWNELVVSKPKAAAIYGMIDNDQMNQNYPSKNALYVSEHMSELVEKSHETKLPLVIQIDGQWIVKLRYNPDTNEMVEANDHIEQKDIYHLLNGLTNEYCRERLEATLDGNIFDVRKLGSREIRITQQSASGYEKYLELNTEVLARDIEPTPFESKSLDFEGCYFPPGENIKIIHEARLLGCDYVYFTNTKDVSHSHLYKWHVKNEINYIDLLNFTKWQIEFDETLQAQPNVEDMSNSHKYLFIENQRIAKKTENIANISNREGFYANQSDETLERWTLDNSTDLENSAGILFGYANAAEECGDIATAERAREIATSVLGQDVFDSIIEHRVSEDGGLILYESDFL